MQQPSMQILIRASSGPAVGCGPVLRMMALAQSAWRLGAEITFACGPVPAGLEQRLRQARYRLERLRGTSRDAEDDAGVMQLAKLIGADWVVVDGQHVNDQWTESMADENGNVMSPADMGMTGHPEVTAVTVVLEDLGGKTKMVMVHAGIPADSPGAGGWGQAFDKMAAVLADG